MKKIYTLFSALCLAAAAPGTLSAQNNFKLVEESVSNPDNTPAPVYPVPSERQLKWNETEFYAFFHYGMNTYTNEEWVQAWSMKQYSLLHRSQTRNSGSK